MERIDELCLNGYKIYQDDTQFCFGTDAVLLYDFVKQNCGKTADLCSGNGAVALMLLGGGKSDDVTAVELQENACKLLEKSARINGCKNRLTIVNADICNIKGKLLYSEFDTVCVNPPYFKKGSGILPPEQAVALARHEVACTLKDVLECAVFLLKNEGDFYMVHRRTRQAEILAEMQNFGLKVCEIRKVFSTPDKESELILFHAVKTADTPSCKQSTFTVLNEDRSLSDEYKAILKVR